RGAGLMRLAPVALMLLGPGPLAGRIAQSDLQDVLSHGLTASGVPAWLLAPGSGALRSRATASTTAGPGVASGGWSPAVRALGVSAV
ncbi:GntP family permease, partial [Salmonella enterica subsp. enterica serovar Infantis]